MTTHTLTDLTHALRRHAQRTSMAEANRVLESVAGTTELRGVDPAKFSEVIIALDDGAEPPPDMFDAAGNVDPVKAFARFNAAGRGRGRGRTTGGDHE